MARADFEKNQLYNDNPIEFYNGDMPEDSQTKLSYLYAYVQVQIKVKKGY